MLFMSAGTSTKIWESSTSNMVISFKQGLSVMLRAALLMSLYQLITFVETTIFPTVKSSLSTCRKKFIIIIIIQKLHCSLHRAHNGKYITLMSVFDFRITDRDELFWVLRT